MTAFDPDLGISDAGFVAGGGYRSTSNVRRMAADGFGFIMGADVIHKKSRKAVDSLGGSLEKRHVMPGGVGGLRRAVTGLSLWNGATMRVYYSPSLADDHRKHSLRLIEPKEETLARLKELAKMGPKLFQEALRHRLGQGRHAHFDHWQQEDKRHGR